MNRRAIRLDDSDLIAGAQILSWIALPHRPEFGVALINQWYWARKKFRGEPVPVLPWPLKKQSRFETQLSIFDRKVLDGLRAGLWLQRKCWAALPEEWPSPIVQAFRSAGASTRALAAARSHKRGSAQANEIRDIWTRHKPISHLAWAVADTLGGIYADEGREGFDLERTVFLPNWVSEALDRAENVAANAEKSQVVPISELYRFHRDSF